MQRIMPASVIAQYTVTCVQDFHTQADSLKAVKHLAGPPAEIPSSLAGAVRTGKRTLVLVGGLLLGALVLYVMWPQGSGFNYGFDGVEETEHFVTVSGTQVRHPQPFISKGSLSTFTLYLKACKLHAIRVSALSLFEFLSFP